MFSKTIHKGTTSPQSAKVIPVYDFHKERQIAEIVETLRSCDLAFCEELKIELFNILKERPDLTLSTF